MTGEAPPLYHWSPRERREVIAAQGLRPGQPAVGGGDMGDWRAPYVCLAETPAWAWALSGDVREGVGMWDLWQVRLANGHTVTWRDEELPGWGCVHYEWRVWDTIKPQGLVWVAERRGK